MRSALVWAGRQRPGPELVRDELQATHLCAAASHRRLQAQRAVDGPSLAAIPRQAGEGVERVVEVQTVPPRLVCSARLVAVWRVGTLLEQLADGDLTPIARLDENLSLCAPELAHGMCKGTAEADVECLPELCAASVSLARDELLRLRKVGGVAFRPPLERAVRDAGAWS